MYIHFCDSFVKVDIDCPWYLLAFCEHNRGYWIHDTKLLDVSIFSLILLLQRYLKIHETHLKLRRSSS